jgi:hypothetical protein
MIRPPSTLRRRVIVAALVTVPVAVAGLARTGHTQHTIQGGLWRGSDGNLYCGGACGPNQVCCTITINES